MARLCRILAFCGLAALAALVGCNLVALGTAGMSGSLSRPCAPTDLGQRSRFTYRVLEPAPAGDEKADVVEVDGQRTRYQAGILVLGFDAADVEMILPEGNLPGIQAHHELIEPVLRDFGLEVVQQIRLPLTLEPTVLLPDSGVRTPPPITHWKVQPRFLVGVVGAESDPLTDLQADATALGMRGDWVFHGRRAAGLFARSFRLTRRKGCYGLIDVGPDGLLTLDYRRPT